MPRPNAPAVHGGPNVVLVMGDAAAAAAGNGSNPCRTPNLHRVAAEGMLLTDYYAEAITTVPAPAESAAPSFDLAARVPAFATALKEMGYATGHFGRSHLGARNEDLPTRHGFDEFFGWLHDPAAATQEGPRPRRRDAGAAATSDGSAGSRNVLHAWASPLNDLFVDPRWGPVGRQRIEEVGTLLPKRMEMVNDEMVGHALCFIDSALARRRPFLACVSPLGNARRAGMASDLDEVVGALMKRTRDDGLDGQTILIVTTTGAAAGPPSCLVRWPGRLPAGQVEGGLTADLDWLPALVAAADDPDVFHQLRQAQAPDYSAAF